MKIIYKQESIHWESAQKITEIVTQHAISLDVQIAVAVVDKAGHLVAFLKTEECPFLSIDIAIDKAYTAASFVVPTSQWQTLLPAGSILREGILNRARFVGFSGGVPIVINNKCIGAIGVSGASEEQDESCAKAGLDAVI